MADNWDDILAEPIATLADPTAVTPSDGDEVVETPGAWLAVHALSDISPRQQEAPMTLPSIETALQIRLPVQAETQEASPRLPPSLADQLSLTWAARRRHVPEAEPEPDAEPAPRPIQQRSAAPAAAEPAEPVPTWRKPFEAVARVFARPAPQPVPAQAPRQQDPAAVRSTSEQRTVIAIAEPAPVNDSRGSNEPPVTEASPSGATMPGVPLTLATPQRRSEAPEPEQTPPTPRAQISETSRIAPSAQDDVPLSQTPVVRTARLETPQTLEAPAPRTAAADGPVAEAGATTVDTQAPSAPSSLAPRKGLLAWLVPRRTQETQERHELAPAHPARPAASPPVSVRPPSPATPEAPLAATEPTLAQAVPALRRAAESPQQDHAEPELTPEALAGLPPEVALTHLLRNTPAGTGDDADAETVRQTLARMVDAAPSTEPARVDTADDQGETLPAVLQQRMEGLLDVPLHEVRIFRGQVSQRLTDRVQADAVTIGNQVHVAHGEGNPSLPSGRALLAHEVTHYAVHRVESDGPAATLSGASDASATPTWPQFTGIAPEPGTPSYEAEETLALRVEHKMSRPDAFDAPFAVPGMQAPNTAALPLQHRAQPAPIFVAPGGVPGPSFGSAGGGAGAGGFGGFSAGAFSGGGRFGAGISNGGGVGMAPWDRMVSDAGDFMAAASDTAGQVQDAAQEVQETAEDFEDNDEMIEKVAEAVIKHMEDKDKFERERRGAFDGSLGG